MKVRVCLAPNLKKKEKNGEREGQTPGGGGGARGRGKREAIRAEITSIKRDSQLYRRARGSGTRS